MEEKHHKLEMADGEAEEEEIRVTTVPTELLEQVFARLPISQLLPFRSLSKSWNARLRSPDFLRLHFQHAPPETWFLMADSLESSRHGISEPKILVVDNSSKRWRWIGPPTQFLERFGFERAFHISGSARGVTCSMVIDGDEIQIPGVWGRENLRCSAVLLLNWLTGSVKVLPPCPGLASAVTIPYCMAMSFDSGSASYRIAVMMADTHIEIYESRTGCWKVHPHALWGSRWRSAWGGKNYVGEVKGEEMLWISRRQGRVFKFEMGEGRWSEVEGLPALPLMSDEKVASDPTIFQYKQELVLVAAMWQPSEPESEGDFPEVAGFVVWKLERQADSLPKWVEIARTPPHLWQELFFTQLPQAHFTNVGDLILMTAHDCFSHQNGPWSPLLYDLALSQWHYLAPSPDHSCLVSVCGFQPNLLPLP